MGKDIKNPEMSDRGKNWNVVTGCDKYSDGCLNCYAERHELGMKSKLADVLGPGMEVVHEYDFGDTTELLVKVVAQYEGVINAKRPIEILARNDPPEILCNECGQALAVEIRVEYQSEDSGWLCESCARKHGCDEEMRLPVVNSPRTGVCGYTG
jgi:hypothetical protein